VCAEVYACIHIHTHTHRSIIVRQGDPVEQLMWVERGSCAVLVCFRADSHVSKRGIVYVYLCIYVYI